MLQNNIHCKCTEHVLVLLSPGAFGINDLRGTPADIFGILATKQHKCTEHVITLLSPVAFGTNDLTCLRGTPSEIFDILVTKQHKFTEYVIALLSPGAFDTTLLCVNRHVTKRFILDAEVDKLDFEFGDGVKTLLIDLNR